jgi:hypothetical protein
LAFGLMTPGMRDRRPQEHGFDHDCRAESDTQSCYPTE